MTTYVQTLYYHVLVTRHGVWIGNWIIEQLQIVSIGNYNAISNLHTLQSTIAHANSSQFVFTSRFQVTALNNVDF
jgi:hypothetical protein